MCGRVLGRYALELTILGNVTPRVLSHTPRVLRLSHHRSCLLIVTDY